MPRGLKTQALSPGKHKAGLAVLPGLSLEGGARSVGRWDGPRAALPHFLPAAPGRPSWGGHRPGGPATPRSRPPAPPAPRGRPGRASPPFPPPPAPSRGASPRGPRRPHRLLPLPANGSGAERSLKMARRDDRGPPGGSAAVAPVTGADHSGARRAAAMAALPGLGARKRNGPAEAGPQRPLAGSPGLCGARGSVHGPAGGNHGLCPAKPAPQPPRRLRPRREGPFTGGFLLKTHYPPWTSPDTVIARNHVNPRIESDQNILMCQSPPHTHTHTRCLQLCTPSV